jgi:ABC-2 type transport system permease protein
MQAMSVSGMWLRSGDVLAASAFEWTFYWRRRRLRAATVLAALPVLLALLVAVVKIANLDTINILARGVDILPYIFATFYLRVLVVALPLLSSTILVSREVEGGTLPFLLVRPLSRSSLLIGKFLGSWWTLCALACGSYFAVTMILLVADGFADSAELLLATPAYLVTLCAGTLAYGAFFTLIGLVTRRPALVGLFVAILWENLIPYLPGLIRNFTVRYHLSAMIPDLGLPSEWLGTTDIPPLLGALAWLLVGVSVSLTSAAAVFSRRDFT